jgi:sortase (surface protein transpeptidase)
LLKNGEIAYYTDGIGEEYAYEVAWVDHPAVKEWGKGSSWAETPTPVITLITCDDGTVVGDDAYRIIVRLVPTQIPTISPTEIPSQLIPTS